MALIDKGIGATSRGFGALPRKYLPFPDDKFGIWYDDENFCIGSNKITIDSNDIIIGDEKYRGTHGLWRLLTNPNKKKLDQETHDTWWTNKDNFTEKDLSLYKEILFKTYSIYQHNDPSTKSQSLVLAKSGTICY